MTEVVESILIFSVIIFIVAIVVYVLESIFLYKFNKLVYGKGTPLAWIPICNIYLLGKLAVNKIVGWILVIILFLTGTYTVTVNGVEETYTILPEGIHNVLTVLYYLVFLGLFVYAIIKYMRIKKSRNTQQPMQPQQPVQPQQPMQSQQNQNNSL